MAAAARQHGNEIKTEAADDLPQVGPAPLLWANNKSSAMQRLFTATLMASIFLFAGGAQACEKHLHGHQTNSNTAAEAVKN